MTCSKHLALPFCLITFSLTSNSSEAPPSLHLLSIWDPSLPIFFLEGSGCTRSTSPDVSKRTDLGNKAHRGAVTFILTLWKSNSQSAVGLQLGTMRACVPLTVVVLCGLAWAGNFESCASRCNEKFNRDAACQCDRRCSRHGDCCEDYEHLCTAKEEPEEFLELEEEGPDSSLYSAPSSCQGRCHEAFDKHHPCHCNDRCQEFGNCCEDFESLCGNHEGFSHSSDAITKEELQSISEKIYRADINKAQKKDIVLNSQNRISPSETGDQVDRCPEPLFTYVNEQLFSKPTYAAFINLLNNYQPATGHGEHFSAQQLAEQGVFLREIMKTAVMKELYNFLHHQNRYGSEEEFVDDLKNMWFGLYSRGNEEADSSGFEHVFSGEIKRGKVTGFHNWIRFYLQEKEGLVDYYSHIYDGPWDSYPDVLAMQFNWDGYYKEVGSAFIGSSPEFEFALYSLCFIARPGKVCQLSLGGYPLAIQTYPWDKTTYGNGKKYIATAYVVSSTQ